MVELKLKLPDGFLDEEVRCGYKVTSEMKKLWAVELDLLAEFMRVCDKYGIEYYADSGTILGAVRHKGYIPWDDDIDIIMMRDQYDKLCSVANEFQHPYFFQTEYSDRGSLRRHAQLRNSLTTGILATEIGMKLKFNQGIFIDIFPIDAIPDDDEVFDKQLEELSAILERVNWRMYFTTRYTSVKTAKEILRFPFHCLYSFYCNHIIDYDSFYREYEQICKRFNNEDTQRVAKLYAIPFNKKQRLWPRSYFEKTVYMPFEMFNIPMPSGYEEILTQYYGDWEKFEIGTVTHGGLIFDTEINYRDYLARR